MTVETTLLRWNSLPSTSFSSTVRPILFHNAVPLARSSSTATRAAIDKTPPSFSQSDKGSDHGGVLRPKFFRLSTPALLRNVILGKILQTPPIYGPCLRVLNIIAHSKSPLLNADRNPLIRLAIYPFIYKQFCAGRNKVEVQKTIDEIKRCGYSGVILCYSKEIMVRKDSEKSQVLENSNSDAQQTQQEIQEWRQGNLATLATVGKGDYIGVKYTGAGPSVSNALKGGRDPPAAVLQALYDICDQARNENKRLWIDAEQQIYHPTIDQWTLELMRKYNRNGQVVVLTTIQAYLKSARDTVEWYLRQSQTEGWTLGIKLVRGAYIGSDVRSRIHDAKAQTDACYDSIVHDLLTKTWKNVGSKDNFPDVQVFLAGHNVNSIRQGGALAQRLAMSGELKEPVHYGLLQGMADDIGCEMLSSGEKIIQQSSVPDKSTATDGAQLKPATAALAAPKVYKCLTWGSVHDCLHYLVRRAIENHNAAEKLGEGLQDMKRELWRRLTPWRWTR